MKKYILFLIFVVCVGLYFFVISKKQKNILSEERQIETLLKREIKQDEEQEITRRMEIIDITKLYDDFSQNYILEESGKMKDSKNTKWWVNSGAFLYSENGIGRTIMGKLDKNDKWRIDYRNYNSDETDDGYYPQNIFRLVTKSKWKNFNQEAYFKIKKYNLSKSKHRFESNGILLFNRYQDGDNLYYTGLRVDGAVVIKKKYKGRYYLMGYKKILTGKYDKRKNPNLILENKWMGIKSKVKTINGNQVEIKVFTDSGKTGNWKEILSVIDDGEKYGGNAILSGGYAGIRTDFMDVEFDDYKIEEVN